MSVEVVPSKDVRRLMSKLGWELSDRDRAALLHALELPPARESSELIALADELDDAIIRVQVDEYVARQDEQLALFERNGGGAVYEIRDIGDDGEPLGRFASLEAAVGRGRILGRSFEVSKHRISGAEGAGERRATWMANPFLMPDGAAFEDLATTEFPEDCTWPLAWAYFDPDGQMTRFGSSELPPESRADVERKFDPTRFENAFVELPSPFEAGDIVRTVAPCGREGRAGIVETGREEWAEMTGRLKSSGYADFSDGALVVSFLKGGTFAHEHVPPAFIERFDPPENDPARELLLRASDLVAGSGGLDWFLLALDAYRRQMAKQ